MAQAKRRTSSSPKRRRGSENRQSKQRETYSNHTTAVTTARGKGAGKGFAKPTTGTKKNNRISGKVITNNTSSKSFRRGTMKRFEKKYPMTAFLISPILIFYKKIKAVSSRYDID